MRLYIGTYTGPKSRGIYRVELDEQTGQPGQPELAAEVANPTFLALHPHRPVLYAASEVGNFDGEKTGAVAAFAIAGDGGLSPLNALATGGSGPCHVSVDPSGRVLLVANYGGGSVAAMALADDGALRERTDFAQHEGKGPNERRQSGPHAHSFVCEPRGRYALAADLGIDQVVIYRLDAGKGEIARHAAASLAPGAGPRHITFHPQRPVVYVINELDNTVTAFDWDADAGSMSAVQTVPTLPDGFNSPNTSAEVTLDPSGRFLYGSNRGHDSIAVFAVDAASGRLEAKGHVSSGGKGPRHFAFAPGGNWVVVANQQTDSLVTYAFDSRSGGLTPTGRPVEVGAPVCVRFMKS
jgi:6-phosphogluconolactonase